MRKCCCLILNYNDAKTVCKLVDSIAKYKCFEYILVVDNCSTDDSYKVLNCRNDIVLTKTKYNGGYGAGNNIGIKFAKDILKTKYVLLCNPDVKFSEKLVESLLDIIENDNNCAVVSAVQYDMNYKSIKDKAWKIPSGFRYALTFSSVGKKLAKIHYADKYFEENDIIEVDCIPGALLMIDTVKFLEIGGYDEKMFLYCEEDTIGYKIKKAGYKTLLLTKKHYVHEHGASINKTLGSSVSQYKLINKNKLFFMKKYLKANFLIMLIGYVNSGIKLLNLKLKIYGELK